MKDDATILSYAIWTGWVLVSSAIAYVIANHIKKMSRMRSSAARMPQSFADMKPLRVENRAGGLNSEILQEGSGKGAKNGDTLTVQYTAYLTTGEKVDSSYDRGRPFTFQLGKGTVIIGWDSALQGVKAGERRKVHVPAKMAYGNKGQNLVPPGATVIFDIEVLNIE